MMLLRVIAVFGVIAVLGRLARALLALVGGGVEMFLARDLAEVRRQRGDISGMAEAAELRARGRQARARALMLVLFWIALLAVPPLTPWPMHMYAAYALLWILPGGSKPWRVSVRTSANTLERR